MNSEIKVGFSMHPHWLGAGDLTAFVEPLCRVGLSALEFELDDRQDCWREFEALMQSAAILGLDLSFHAPFRAPHTLVGFASSQRTAIQDDYAPLLAIAEHWGEGLGSLRTVVIHAAAGRMPANQETLQADTLAFLDWGLGTFPHIRFALENNSPAQMGEVKTGENLTSVLAILDTLRHERLVACWDMGHDYLVRGDHAPLPKWLSFVGHVHVHDVNEKGVDHYPLIFQRVPYQAWLPLLPAAGMRGIAVLELKGGHLKDWPLDKISAGVAESVLTIAQGVR